MYYYSTVNDIITTHSELLEKDGFDIVNVHFERPNDDGFDSLDLTLPGEYEKGRCCIQSSSFSNSRYSVTLPDSAP